MRIATTFAPEGMVASVDHLASSAGIAMLRGGGNAVDAAIAASAVLAVTAPQHCGMGGDLFALVHRPGGGAPLVLNASGRAGSGADPDRLRADGHTEVPELDDIRAATVPGCVDGWLALHEAHGRLPLEAILAPAIGYAADGFPVGVILAAALPLLAGVNGAEDLYGDGRRTAGDRIVRPGVARSLAAVVAEGRAGFYQGEFGEGLLAIGQGEFVPADLITSSADWVDPLRVRVWDHDVWTVPPNSQGYLSLLGLRIAEGLDLGEDPGDARWAHGLVEAARAAAFDRLDVLHEHADVSALLDDVEVARRRGLVASDARSNLRVPHGAGGTMFLCAVDGERMGASLIQSNAAGFGCRVFEPATGIGLHSRGIGFSLVQGHPAEYGPGRRPPHTLSPALVTRPDGGLRAVVGTMGGDAQPQIVLQVVTRLLREGASAASSVASPRWALSGPGVAQFGTWTAPDDVVVEVDDRATRWLDGLAQLGHPVTATPSSANIFGHAQVIEVRPDGMLAGAADPRASNAAAIGF